jgi:polysaccharide chain length determinant protein (PEP-CTERM system associated)
MKDLSNLEVIDYFRILWNRRWYFLILFVLMATGTSVYAWRAPDIYKSTARIQVDPTLSSEEVMRTNAYSVVDGRISSVRELLATRSFLERMIQTLPLYGYGTDPNFVMERAVIAVQNQVHVEKASDRAFTVSFTSPDPQIAQSVTRQMTQELLRNSVQASGGNIRSADQFMDKQMEEADTELKDKEERLAQFKLIHHGELPEQEAAITSNIANLKNQYATIENSIQQRQRAQSDLNFLDEERRRSEQERQQLREDLARAGTPVPLGTGDEMRATPDEIELARKKDALDQALTKYTKNHPDVVVLQKAVQSLEQKMQASMEIDEPEPVQSADATAGTPKNKATGSTAGKQDEIMENRYRYQSDLYKTQIAQFEKEKREIQQEIKVLHSRLTLAPEMAMQLTGIQRELEKAKTAYESLLKTKQSTGRARDIETGRKNEIYQIVDEANLPVRAEYPDRMQIVLMGIGGGFVLGIGAAFARELLDSTIGTEDEAKKILNLPVLAAIPVSSGKPERKRPAA